MSPTTQSAQSGQTVVTGYTYDHNGNQIIKNAMVLSSEGGARSFALGENNSSTEFFTYDLRNRLTQYKNGETKTSYTYGADGFRNSKTVNGVLTSFIYDGANIVETKQGETVTDYIRGIGLIKYADGTTTAYYFTDDHGSTSSLYNVTGTKLADYTYDAFGNEETISADTNPFRYCGEYTDSETGLVYLRARYYDPQTGRFVSEDPAKDGLNWYVYCGNNSVMFVDPSGWFRIVDGKAYDKYQIGSGNIDSQNDDYISEDIKKMQIRLQELGFLDESFTRYGYFGDETLAAVNAFKEANNIQNDTKETKGIVGATTWALMGLDFDVIESVGLTLSNVSMSKGVLRVDRNIVNANMVNTYYAADAIKDAYKVAFGEDFNVTTDSVYLELVGHIFADELAETNKGGILDPLWKRVQRSTGIIDIGDNVIVSDKNRWIWDWISKLGGK